MPETTPPPPAAPPAEPGIRVKTLTVAAKITRSHRYQSATATVEIALEIDDQDKAKARTIQAYQLYASELATAEAAAALDHIMQSIE